MVPVPVSSASLKPSCQATRLPSCRLKTPWVFTRVAVQAYRSCTDLPDYENGNQAPQARSTRALAARPASCPQQDFIRHIRSLQLFQRTDTHFLKNVLAPVENEVFYEHLKVVAGSVPKELNGMFLRTGPNPQHQPWGGYHWFDGDGMVHAVHFGDGQAKSYSNHWIRCNRFLAERNAGSNVYMRVGDLKGWWGVILMLMHRVAGVEAKLHDMPAGNTALVWHSGKLLALMEGSVPFLLRVASGSVESMHSYTFGGTLEHECCAHPKIDPKTGEMISFACKQVNLNGVEAQVAYFTVSASGHKSPSYPVDVQAPQVMHDFAVTESYAVFMDHALIFDPQHMIKEKSLPFRTDRAVNSRIGLLKRAAPEEGVQWFEVEPFVGLHTATAWEEGSKVHLVVCRYEYLSLMDAQHSEQPAAPGELFRYTVDVATGSVTETRLSTGLDTDFPIIPPHLLTQPAKFCYVAAKSVSDGRNGIMKNRIAKYDMTADEDKGLVATIQLPEGVVGGEFNMVPRHAPSSAAEAAEDDGWLVGYCTHERTFESFCMVYDARTMSSTPVAKVEMPQRVPLGFHGTFLHQEQLLQQQCVAADAPVSTSATGSFQKELVRSHTQPS